MPAKVEFRNLLHPSLYLALYTEYNTTQNRVYV